MPGTCCTKARFQSSSVMFEKVASSAKSDSPSTMAFLDRRTTGIDERLTEMR